MDYEIVIYDTPVLFNPEDAVQVEVLETAYKAIWTDLAELEKNKEPLSGSEYIRRQCSIFAQFFDSVCGEGTSDKIFRNQKTTISVYENAVVEFLDALPAARAASAARRAERWQKYFPKKKS
ncbi:MAG: hypothetical protein IJJ69_04060 [Oscillospiraceae bacterium]|nr:hypothetical protein [Oscillospiraceae bacterium]